MAKPSGSRFSWVLLLVLVVALGVGAAASVLVGASTSGPAPAPSHELEVPLWVAEAGMFGILAVVVASLVLQRRGGPAHPGTNRALVVALTVILLGVLFVVAMRAAGVGGQSTGGYTLVPPPPTTNSTSTNNTTSGLTGPGGTLQLFPNIPFWVPFVVLAVVAAIVAVVAVPTARQYLAERRQSAVQRRRTAEVPAQVRQALERASNELDLGGDPRLVILALYHEMILHLQPMVGSVETSTAEEIRTNHLVRLGVRPEAARTLTRLFEEARYSTHPLGPDERERAKEAVAATLEDLDRRPPQA